jgi:hypothetical protein
VSLPPSNPPPPAAGLSYAHVTSFELEVQAIGTPAARVTSFQLEVQAIGTPAARVTAFYLEVQVPTESTTEATASGAARVQTEPEAVAGGLARAGATPEITAGGLAAVQASQVVTLGGLGKASAAGGPTLAALARVTDQGRVTLGALGRTEATPSALLGALALVSGDQATQLLGGVAAVENAGLVTFGGLAHVVGDQFMRLFAMARVGATPQPILGALARVGAGRALSGQARVQVSSARVAGGLATVAAPGAIPTPGVPDFNAYAQFWPDAGRRFAGEERAYLEIMYVNYPLPAGSANLAWIADNVYLPVNAARLDFDEPVKELRLDSLQGRHLVVVEQEAATPRVTRPKTFRLEFPALSIHLLRFFKVRERLGIRFFLRFRLFDTQADYWEPLYSDPAEPATFGKVFWGTLKDWQPGSVALRRNGCRIEFDTVPFTIDHALGKVTFTESQGESLIEAQFIYEPLVQVVSIEAEPRPGHKFARFAPKVTLLELTR